jgi:glycosyltransferase involved in cell wall biosynthesis
MGGAARHLEGFLPALERVGREHKYLLYVNERLSLGSLLANFHVHRLPVQSAWQRLWWDQVTLPRLALEERADVVLALLSFGSVRPSRPQITFLRDPVYCKYYLLGATAKQRLNIAIRRWILHLTVQASKLVVVPAVSTWHMITLAHPNLQSKDVRVLPHGFDKEQFLASKNLSEAMAKLLPPQLSGNFVRLLYVGHILPYKDFDTMLLAVRLLADRGLNFKLYLTIARENWPVGFDRWRAEVSRLHLDDYIVVLGRVPANVVPKLYHRCDVLWFPSLCETFGWPIIEAMSCSLPIVAADTPLSREMAGGAAFYYPPFDAPAAAQAVAQLLLSPDERRRLGEVGQKRAETHVHWDEYVRTVLNYCGEVAVEAGPQEKAIEE